MKQIFTYYPFFIKILFSFFLIFSFYVIFLNLGKSPLENWDEAWYGEMTKQMLKTREFIVLQWNGAYSLDKPPLSIWLNIFFSVVLGLSEFSLRLTSAISGFAIILTVLIYSYKKWGFVPSLIAYVSILLNNIFIWRTRSGNIDLLLALLIFITYFLILSKSTKRYIFLGILFALIYLTKASIVIFPLSIFLIHEVLYRRKEVRKNIKNYILLFSVFVGISSLWLFLGYLKIGEKFVTYYLFNSDQGVARITLQNFNKSYLEHAYYSLQRRYFYVFILGLIFLIKGIKKPTNFLLFSFSTFLLFFLSFSHKDNNWYLIPSMPFWSLVIAYATYEVLNLFKNFKIISLPIILLVLYMSYKTYTVNILPIINTYSIVYQTESALKIKQLTQNTDIVARLDHLYPTTIYYSDRIIFASPPEVKDTVGYWISRKDLIESIKQKRIKWLVGPTGDIDLFMKENPTYGLEKIVVNKEEAIVKLR